MKIPPGLVAAWERLKHRETKEDRRLVASVAWSAALGACILLVHFLL